MNKILYFFFFTYLHAGTLNIAGHFLRLPITLFADIFCHFFHAALSPLCWRLYSSGAARQRRGRQRAMAIVVKKRRGADDYDAERYFAT